MILTYAAKSVCPSCKRMVRNKPDGGPHCWHGCRLRWVARKVARAGTAGWHEGYQFALDNISDPMVYADLNEYGTGWAGAIANGGIRVEVADTDPAPNIIDVLSEGIRSAECVCGHSRDMHACMFTSVRCICGCNEFRIAPTADTQREDKP